MMAKKKLTQATYQKAGVPMGHRIMIRADDEVMISGIDYETRRIQVLARNEHAIVLKVPGRMCWDGRWTPRRYVSPEILVFRVVKDLGREIIVEPLIEWSTGRDKGN